MSDEELVRNLLDCGCDKRTVAAFRECASCGDTARELELLSEQRRTLLTKVHTEEKKISFLDYLVHKIEKDANIQKQGGTRR